LMGKFNGSTSLPARVLRPPLQSKKAQWSPGNTVICTGCGKHKSRSKAKGKRLKEK
jgi:hypothetical protein